MSVRVALCALLAVAACSEREQPSRPRGLTASEAPRAPASAPSPAPGPVVSPPAPRSLPSPFATGAPDPGALANRESEPAALPEAGSGEPEATKRNLAVELAQLVGQPLSCVDFAAIVAGGGKVNITVGAQVVPSGRITRAEATAPGQPEKALRCIEQLVTAGSLQGPVPGAPRKVTTSVVLQVVENPR